MTLRARALVRGEYVGTFNAAALPFAVIAVVVLLVPLFAAAAAPLTSDESLYLAEAYSIAHGDGFEYPSGEPITHRAPLHPLVLAPAVVLAGNDAAYAVSKLIIAVDALLVLLIAWRMGGALAGWIAGCAAAASVYLYGLGTTLYVDPLQCAFMLLAFWALYEATPGSAGGEGAAGATRTAADERRAISLFAAAGACVGLAFLVKESAVQWVPLAVVAWLALPSLRARVPRRALVAFFGTSGAAVAPWFIWVFAHTGGLYMVGEVPGARFWLVVTASVVAAVRVRGAFARLQPPAASSTWFARLPAVRPGFGAAAIVVAWGGFMLWALTRHATWPYPNDYATTVPGYMMTVAPQAQPYFVIVAAWAWIAWRSATRDDARLILVAAALFAPFALFAANRNLQLRDALPLVYLSYIALGLAAADAVRIIGRRLEDRATRAVVFGAVGVVAAAFIAHEVIVFRTDNREAAAKSTQTGAWDGDFARRIAAWMETNLPADARVLTSRLYFSSLYVETEGRFEIRQMPTVRVSFDAEGERFVTPRSNLFRWGDGELRAGDAGDSWLYFEQFPGKRYWVGLSEEELLEYIGAHEIEYVVLTGEDVAFSTLSYAGYLSGHPAFTLMQHARATAADQLFVYAVDRSKLATRAHATALTPASATALERATGLDRADLADRLGTPLRVTDSDAGLSAREEAAALAGVDSGVQ